MAMKVLAIDPGREKCGVCVMDADGSIDYQYVIETERLSEIVSKLSSTNEIGTIVIGDGTTNRDAQQKLSALEKKIPVEVVDEKHTTELARKLYWIKNPPRGWRRLLPTSMMVPPEPVDHIVAEILAQRFLQRSLV
ncbi:MAG: Holliday junction resolvase RuvX [Selenomonadaceae bacterium]|nr:Holliday junction resolvase RuvX [Selenomonadaceae bacterium]